MIQAAETCQPGTWCNNLRKWRLRSAIWMLTLGLLALAQGCNSSSGSSASSSKPPNIVFIVMDDVGIDQMGSFWKDGSVPESLPNLKAIANAGVKFTNVWVMPECSPSRAAFFTGRYPLRTGVTSALIDNMLPAAQTSPYETTLPRVLATAGYQSAMIGKFHLGDQNPAGDCSPATLGFDYFDGNLGASPGSIDTQAGITSVAHGTYPCGFDQSGDSGACYLPDGSCNMTTNGKDCLENTGLFLVDTNCQVSTPPILDFTRTNSYYIWARSTVIGAIPPPTGPNQCGNHRFVQRQYMTEGQTNSSVAWWNGLMGRRMLSVTYNSIHTPYQQPPQTPLLSGLPFVCVGNTTPDIVSQRQIAAAMLQTMDADIGHLLAGMGLARLDTNGTIITVAGPQGPRIPELERNNTMVAIVGDNGTYGVVVAPPFDPARSKGTVYQTGVWVPALIAGAPVKGRHGRIVDAMVNAVDFFQLFSDVAKVKANEIVPPAHHLDSLPMLSYLTNPKTPPQRDINFTQLGPGVFQVPTHSATRSWPCAIAATVGMQGGSPTLEGGVCSDVLFATQSFCEQENNGVWLGPQNFDQPPLQFPNPDTPDHSWNSCCGVRNGLNPTLRLLPKNQWATRDARFKFVREQQNDCSEPLCPGPECDRVFPPFGTVTFDGFYDLSRTIENPAGLDCSYGTLNSACPIPNDLACAPESGNPPESCVPDELKPEYEKLQASLDDLLASEPVCTGDGNLDKFVNQFDVDGVNDFLGVSSFFDFNNDATTDLQDLAIVEANLGANCVDNCIRSDLNRDGKVNSRDLRLLNAAVGKPCALCGADLNGDGVVNQLDKSIMKQSIATCN